MSAARAVRYSASSLLLPALRIVRWVASPSANAFRILTLHHVRQEQFPVLEKLLDFISAQHRFLTPAEAERMAMGDLQTQSVRGSVPFLLTFDDGFQSNFEVAASLLAPRAIKALFFICPLLIEASVDEQRSLTAQYVFDGAVSADSLGPELVLMNWKQIADLRAAGHAIGSHASSHRRLSTLSESELIKEIDGSAKILNQKLAEGVSWFAYPFGTVESINPAAYAVIRRTYRFCCSAVRGVNDGESPMALFRENIELETPPHYQRFVCEGGLDFYYRNKRRQLLAMLRQN
jgi:peptidoglycan/xylan/chitin deacetylase (PgdA/CDA1 family)